MLQERSPRRWSYRTHHSGIVTSSFVIKAWNDTTQALITQTPTINTGRGKGCLRARSRPSSPSLPVRSSASDCATPVPGYLPRRDSATLTSSTNINVLGFFYSTPGTGTTYPNISTTSFCGMVTPVFIETTAVTWPVTVTVPTGGGGGVNEVEISATQPTDPGVEIWFDPDGVPVGGGGGAPILDGVGPPNGDGVAGDYYADTLNGKLYGPKSATWSVGAGTRHHWGRDRTARRTQ